MSVTILKQRLRAAKRSWAKGGTGDAVDTVGFVPGVLKGFTEAIGIVQAYHRERLRKAREEQGMARGLSALVLYRTCQHAYRRLQQSDRRGAMDALARVLAAGVGPKVSRAR